MLKIHTDSGLPSDVLAPPALLLTRRVTFASAHVLRRGDWDEERNAAVFGSCARDHGHNYVLEVSVTGQPDPETGMVLNLRDLDRLVREAVVDQVDHRHLNHDVPFLSGVVPTAENVALACWSRLEDHLYRSASGARLCRVRLTESENNVVEVWR
jgi:6-pyruvoyltetrahydropterin/6-carboxytetrahydropterin synthase